MEATGMQTESLFLDTDRIVTRRTQDEKISIINAFRASGMKMKVWCARNGVSYETLKRWLYKQRLTEIVPKKATSVLAPSNEMSWTCIQPTHSNHEPSADSGSISIVTGSIRIDLPTSASQELVKLVLREVLAK